VTAKLALAEQLAALQAATTRAIIDRQLQERGWTVDSKTLRYAAGARPARGKAMAIAEWPTQSGPADYALFIGTQLIGVVEAKRRKKNISAAVDQAERYSKGFKFDGGAEAIATRAVIIAHHLCSRQLSAFTGAPFSVPPICDRRRQSEIGCGDVGDDHCSANSLLRRTTKSSNEQNRNHL